MSFHLISPTPQQAADESGRAPPVLEEEDATTRAHGLLIHKRGKEADDDRRRRIFPQGPGVSSVPWWGSTGKDDDHEEEEDDDDSFFLLLPMEPEIPPQPPMNLHYDADSDAFPPVNRPLQSESSSSSSASQRSSKDSIRQPQDRDLQQQQTRVESCVFEMLAVLGAATVPGKDPEHQVEDQNSNDDDKMYANTNHHPLSPRCVTGYHTAAAAAAAVAPSSSTPFTTSSQPLPAQKMHLDAKTGRDCENDPSLPNAQDAGLERERFDSNRVNSHAFLGPSPAHYDVDGDHHHQTHFKLLARQDRAHSLPVRRTMSASLPRKPSLKQISGTHPEGGFNSMRPLLRQVSFSQLDIREYNIALSDHPSCSYGPPIQLGWQYRDKQSIAVEEYETTRSPRRSMEEMLLSTQMRQYLLLQRAGYSTQELDQAMREVDRVKRDRMITEALLPASAWDETMESLRERVKQLWTPSR